MSDDDLTPARRPSSIRISQWGLAQAWLSMRPGRLFTITVDARGALVMTAIDAEVGERAQTVEGQDDPSRAAVRALSSLPTR